MNNQMWQTPNGCGPENMNPCQPPNDLGGQCHSERQAEKNQHRKLQQPRATAGKR